MSINHPKNSESHVAGQDEKATDEPSLLAPAWPDKTWTLPYSRWWALAGGVLCGILLRLTFSGEAGGSWAAMRGIFITFVPLAVSAVTVYLARLGGEQRWRDYLALGAIANALFVLGTLLIMIEGLICAVIIIPLFMLYGGVGALIVAAVFKWAKWPKTTVNGFVALPMLLALLIPPNERSPLIDSIERSVIIQERAEKIWPHLMNTQNIQPSELEQGWLYRIGVPLPHAGITTRQGDELVREVTMGKSIRFEQRSKEWRENERVRWTYRFAPDSFPPQALDDHVVIGGHYFDILDTTYSLVKISEKATRLDIKMSYRVSTDFDWYANAVAQLLIGNFGEVVLDFYRKRAENNAQVSAR